MGERVETLDDLLRPDLRVVCVGINPSPVSVAAGHYYQGKLGQVFFGRLRRVGLLPVGLNDWEDDAAFELGVGFTDIVKRPTARAKDLSAEEIQYGGGVLADKLARYVPGLVLFAYKMPAVELCGSFQGSGFIPAAVSNCRVFVMPGPYESAEVVGARLAELRSWINTNG